MRKIAPRAINFINFIVEVVENCHCDERVGIALVDKGFKEWACEGEIFLLVEFRLELAIWASDDVLMMSC